MVTLLRILLIANIVLIGCKKTSTKRVVNQDLVNELEKMVKIDQIAAGVQSKPYDKLTEEEWNQFKDSVFTVHQKRLEAMLNEYDFLGYDIVGKEGSHNFWLMVQHADHDTGFQLEVLKKMKKEVKKKNANAANFAYLTDRVSLNLGKAQIYGTQVQYNWLKCQAYPKKLQDSANVNKRRKEVGLPSLEKYLNEISTIHFEMNKEVFKQNGINEPTLYNEPNMEN